MKSSLTVKNRSINDLIPYINNARSHTKEQIALIAGSIKEFGFNDPIAIDKDKGIISGHGRLEAARLLGLKEIPTIELSHLTKEQKKAYILAHNRIALDAGWDDELLKIELNELNDAGFDLSITGFNETDLEEFTVSSFEGLIDEDEVPDEIKSEAITKPGDVWICGEHRVMCGDSTIIDQVEKLMNGEKPILMVTDPPYGVDYNPEWRDGCDLGVGERSKGKVENDLRNDWTEAYSLFTGDVVYVWHASYFTHIVAKNLIDLGYQIISNIIWVKQHFALSRGDYHWQHEPCWYMVKKGKKHNWQGARDQATTWTISNNNSFGNSKPEETWGHGTQKPVQCMERPILNNSKAGDAVYDPFGGSGTTLIACEKTNRKCAMMEISPAYVDIIIKRWEKFTGKQSKLESTGQTFEELSNERVCKRSAA